MTLYLSSLSTSLKSAVANTDFSNVESAAAEAIQKFDASVKTIMGSAVGEVKGGIQSLTQDIDDAETAGTPNQVPTIGRVTQDVPGISSDLVGTVGGSSSDLASITSSSGATQDGFLQDIITSPAPEAVSASLGNVSGKSTQELNASLSELTTPELGGILTSAVDNSVFKDFQSKVDTFIGQLNETIQANSKFFLLDLGEKLEKNYENTLRGLVDKDVSTSDLRNTFSLVSTGDHDTAFETVSKYIEVPDDYNFITENFPKSDWSPEIVDANTRVNEASAEFKVLSVELSSYADPYSPGSAVAGTNSRAVSASGATIGSRNGTSSSGDNWNFDDITSFEELESIFRNINRGVGKEITGAIVHWSATFLDQNIGTDWVHDIHKARGFAGVGYHLIIRRDGTMQRARPMNRSGAHDENNNTNFLGFCFIGGVNEYSNRAVKPYWRYASADSLTQAQFTTYDGLMRTFHQVFPYAQVQGHYATSTAGKSDPGFDVPGYSQSKFGHTNVISENDARWKNSTDINLAVIRAAGAST